MDLKQFLDIFIYEYIEQGEQNIIYRKCTLLRPMGNFKIGDKIEAMTVNINFTLWHDDIDYDEEL